MSYVYEGLVQLTRSGSLYSAGIFRKVAISVAVLFFRLKFSKQFSRKTGNKVFQGKQFEGFRGEKGHKIFSRPFKETQCNTRTQMASIEQGTRKQQEVK